MADKPKVFVTSRIPSAGLDRIAAACDADVWPEPLPPPHDVLRARAAGCDGLVSLLTDRVDAARRHKVQRVVYAASSSAYGVPVADVQTEADPLTPLSPYAAAKLAGELYMQAFAATYGLETVRLRFFNIFGPRQRADSPYSGVIALFSAALTNGRTPIIFGDGLQSRDFTYVTDVVQALLKAATAANVAGNVYNVGTGQSVSLLELLAALNRQLGTNVAPQHAPPRAGDVRHSRADISRTRRDLGYEPRVAFEDGLAQTLRWMRSGK